MNDDDDEQGTGRRAGEDEGKAGGPTSRGRARTMLAGTARATGEGRRADDDDKPTTTRPYAVNAVAAGEPAVAGSTCQAWRATQCTGQVKAGGQGQVMSGRQRRDLRVPVRKAGRRRGVAR